MDLVRLDRLTAQTLSKNEMEAFRAYLHLVEGEETDAALNAIYAAAESLVETITGHIFRASSWRVEFAGAGDSVLLPLYPVSAITAVTVDGEPLSGGFALGGAAGQMVLTLDAPAVSSVVATVSAGYDGTTFPVPAAGTAAVLMAAADMYIHREAGTETEIRDNPAFKRLIGAVGFIRGGGGAS